MKTIFINLGGNMAQMIANVTDRFTQETEVSQFNSITIMSSCANIVCLLCLDIRAKVHHCYRFSIVFHYFQSVFLSLYLFLIFHQWKQFNIQYLVHNFIQKVKFFCIVNITVKTTGFREKNYRQMGKLGMESHNCMEFCQRSFAIKWGKEQLHFI